MARRERIEPLEDRCLDHQCKVLRNYGTAAR
jgi:hypothetical protein